MSFVTGWAEGKVTFASGPEGQRREGIAEREHNSDAEIEG